MSEKLFIAAVSALQEDQYSVALRLFNELSMENESCFRGDAIHFLAWMYEQGFGVSIDLNKSFDMWVNAAHMSVAESQIAVAECYRLGKGVDIDYLKSFCWYEIANQNMDNQRLDYVKSKIAELEKKLTHSELSDATLLIGQIKKSLLICGNSP